jgi:hypothetical protein
MIKTMKARIDAAIVNVSVILGVNSLLAPLLIPPGELLADCDPPICIGTPE